jgi:hypothetical protein
MKDNPREGGKRNKDQNNINNNLKQFNDFLLNNILKNIKKIKLYKYIILI